MAAERMRLEDQVEISAVCVVDDYRGMALASRPVNALELAFRKRAQMPADDGQAQSSCPAGSIVQYSFFGGIDRFISLRNRATAAAFFRLRFAVGVS
jgi:hypothetical protein